MQPLDLSSENNSICMRLFAFWGAAPVQTCQGQDEISNQQKSTHTDQSQMGPISANVTQGLRMVKPSNVYFSTGMNPS